MTTKAIVLIFQTTVVNTHTHTHTCNTRQNNTKSLAFSPDSAIICFVISFLTNSYYFSLQH